jgi:hypothetical protein
LYRNGGIGTTYANIREIFNSFLNNDSDGYEKASLVSFTLPQPSQSNGVNQADGLCMLVMHGCSNREGRGRGREFYCTDVFFSVSSRRKIIIASRT